MFLDGFKYWLAFKKDDKSYYRCRRHRKGCPAKLWIGSGNATTSPTLKSEHNHPPETERGLVDSFRKVLTRRAATEKLDLHTIYYDEATARHSEAALIYTFSTAESAMAKARRKVNGITSLPDTNDFHEIGEVLRTSNNFRIVSYGQRDQFFEEIYTRSGAVTALVFAHRPTISRLARNTLNEVQVNVTNLHCSSGEIFLLTLHHLDRTAKITPLVYVLLNGKSSDIYAAIFAHIREKLNILPAVVISDCLVDCVHDSLALTFPEASLKANWFEYVASVSRHLQNGPRESFKESANQIILRMILVLPFLPADYVAPGLEAIRKWMRDKGVDTAEGPLASLCRLVETSWLRSVGAGKLSLFRVTISVEDHMKEFHKEVICHLGGGTAVPIWQVIEGLTTIACKVNNRLTRTTPVGGKEREKGGAVKRSQMLSEAIIRNATEQWITQPIHLRSPLQFLQMASHFITGHFLTAVLKQSYACDSSEMVEEEIIAVELPQEETPKSENTRITVELPKENPAKPTNPASEPPPLAFFPRIIARAMLPARVAQTPKEPPPLVPIPRKK